MSYTTSSTTAGPLGLSASLLNRYIHPPFTHKFDRSFISTLTACIENHKYRNYQELEGKFSKWNNNAGSVRAHRGGAAVAPLQHNMLDIIGEDYDSGDESDGSGGEGRFGQCSGSQSW